MLNYLLQSLGTLCSFTGIMYILIGSVAGLLFGSLPGVLLNGTAGNNLCHVLRLPP